MVAVLAPQRRADRLHRVEHGRVAESAGAVARRRDDDEGDVGAEDGLGHVRRRPEPLAVGVDEILQPGFIDWRSARVDGVDEFAAQVDTDDLEPLLANTAARGAPSLPRPTTEICI